MRKLGDNQRITLQSLLEHRGWSPGCGWVWNNYSGTVRLLDSLVRRGLAAKTGTEYRITEAGRQRLK
jgi:hypothetical protein